MKHKRIGLFVTLGVFLVVIAAGIFIPIQSTPSQRCESKRFDAVLGGINSYYKTVNDEANTGGVINAFSGSYQNEICAQNSPDGNYNLYVL